MPPEASVIPSAAFSGILSMTDPMNKDLPEGGLLSATLLLARESPLFEDLLFDFLPRIALAMAYEIPPKINPSKVAGRACVTSNASTNMENVNVAINTPLPKAIIVVINFCDSLKKRDNIQPISKGLDAMKPNTSDSNTP
jgi:hypothetical protein